MGTSLIVIIPEGVETLYKASGNSPSHAERSFAIGQRSIRSTEIFPAGQGKSQQHWARIANPEHSNGPIDGLKTGPDDGFGTAESEVRPTDAAEDDNNYAEPGAPADREPHAWIGVSLICGFILMYLIGE